LIAFPEDRQVGRVGGAKSIVLGGQVPALKQQIDVGRHRDPRTRAVVAEVPVLGLQVS
jgi:hypothetical protein